MKHQKNTPFIFTSRSQRLFDKVLGLKNAEVVENKIKKDLNFPKSCLGRFNPPSNIYLLEGYLPY